MDTGTSTSTAMFTRGYSLPRSLLNYPAVRSIVRDTKFTVHFFIDYVPLRISHPGLYRSARNLTWRFDHISDRSSFILGIAPGMAEFWASTGAMAGYASC